MAKTPQSAGVAKDPFETMRFIEAAALAGAAASARVPALVDLIDSSDYAHRFYADRALVGEQAAYAIRQIGVAPGIEELRRLLADPRCLEFPVACFDQGTYVGDYATRDVAPAGLAAMLVPLLGTEGLGLFRELAMNAASSHEEISASARAAIDTLLAGLTGDEPPRLLAFLRKEATAMMDRPEAKACLARLAELEAGARTRGL